LAEAFRQKFPKQSFLPDVLNVRGEALLAKKDYAAAAGAFADLRKAFPDEPLSRAALLRVSLALYLGKKPADALALLDAPAAKFDEPAARSEQNYLRGLCQFDLKRFPDAAKSFQTSLDLRAESRHAAEAR